MLDPQQIRPPFEATAAAAGVFMIFFYFENPQELLISFIKTRPLCLQRHDFWASTPKSVGHVILYVFFVTLAKVF